MSTYRAKVRTDEIPANDPQNELLPCNRCGSATPRHVLSRTGALCHGCIDAWRREAPAKHGVFSIEEKRAIVSKLGGIGSANPRAWAHLLKAREQAGERLPGYSKRAWREALGEVQ